MKKILLAACLLTATLIVINTSNAQPTKIQAEKKLPWAVEATLNIVLNNAQMILVSQSFTKERNVYIIDFIGLADYDATGPLPYQGNVLINNRGTLISATITPMN